MTTRNVLPVYQSKVDVRAASFVANHAAMTTIVDELHTRLAASREQGSARAQRAHVARGQLTGRERLELLLDEDSPFIEFCPLAGWGQPKRTLGGNTVAGVGVVCGREVMVTAHVPTSKGGAMNKTSVLKGARIAEIARDNNLPTVSLVQTAGADLTQQDKVFHVGGGSFFNLAVSAKERRPTVAVVFGSSTAGGAYMPGMSDYSIFVRRRAKVFLAGPPLVKMAIGEDVDDETLGGAEMHARTSGVADFLARDEVHALLLARQVVASLHVPKRTPLPRAHFARIEEPLYPADELLGIISASVKRPFEAREVIARIVDGSRFGEFKPLYGECMVTAFAKIHGVRVGVLANNGVIFGEDADKASQFIQLCNQSDTPLLFLHNVSGFMVGRKAEAEGIIKRGAHMINSVSVSSKHGVPAISIIMGCSYGAGNYAMCGRAYRPRFLFSFPQSKCSVMGTDQLAGTMDIVMRQAASKAGIAVDEDFAATRKKKFVDAVERQMDAYYTSARCIDDAIIDPRDTRATLGFCFSLVYAGEVRGGNINGVSRM